MEVKLHGKTTSLVELRGYYLGWSEAIDAEVRGGINELAELRKFAESSEVEALERHRDVIRPFYLNAATLAAAPIEPKKDSSGHYNGYDIKTGETYNGPDGLLHAKTTPRLLFGKVLNICDLLRAIEEVHDQLTRQRKTGLVEKFPKINNFLSVLGIEISFERQLQR